MVYFALFVMMIRSMLTDLIAFIMETKTFSANAI